MQNEPCLQVFITSFFSFSISSLCSDTSDSISLQMIIFYLLTLLFNSLFVFFPNIAGGEEEKD